MNTRWLFVLAVTAFILLSVGCRKKDTDSFTQVVTDSIVYTKLDPEVKLTSVTSWNPPTLQYDCNQPVPQTASASYAIDIDLDGQPDFRINISNWYEFHSNDYPCSNFQYYSDIQALLPGDSVAVIAPVTRCAREFSTGAPISEACLFSDFGETVRRYWMSFPCYLGDDKGTIYYGLKMIKGSGSVYGWLLMTYSGNDHTMIIREYAYNRTVGRKILAGQKQ
jgi:hypothetical protein